MIQKKTTLKDYIRHLISQVEELNKDVSKLNEKLSLLEQESKVRNALADEKERRKTGFIALVGALGGVIVLILDFIIKSVSKS